MKSLCISRRSCPNKIVQNSLFTKYVNNIIYLPYKKVTSNNLNGRIESYINCRKFHRKLVSNKHYKKGHSHEVPDVNSSSKDLDTAQLGYDLHHSFLHKHKFIKRDLSVGFEVLATALNKNF